MALCGLTHHAHLVVKLNYLASHLHQLGGNGLQMLGNHILHHHVAPGNRSGAHKGSRLDLVGNNGILRSVQPVYTADANGIRSGALDIGAHTV